VPPESGLRTLAIAAAGCLLLALLVALLTLGISGFVPRGELAPAAYLPTDLLAFAGGMVFLFFLRGVALAFKNVRQAQGVLWCIIGVGASPVLYLFIYLLLTATNAAVGGDGKGLAILNGVVLYLIIGIDLFWFLRVLGEVRRILEKSYLGSLA
jgi:hypothetical protein